VADALHARKIPLHAYAGDCHNVHNIPLVLAPLRPGNCFYS
jgi:hypothetical protein